jgi:hypothetical protein
MPRFSLARLRLMARLNAPSVRGLTTVKAEGDMARKERDLSGQTFNYLTALTYDRTRHRWRCQCVCGAEKLVFSTALLRGDTKSCGCKKGDIIAEKNIRHGHSTGTRRTQSPEYASWAQAIQRCHNEKDGHFADYGGRGIKVCDRWRSSFESFLADMGPRPRGTTIDRVDVNGDYAPGNCRWATPKQQCRNKRTNHYITLRGERLCVSEWSERSGISAGTIVARLARGWDEERAITAPVRRSA